MTIHLRFRGRIRVLCRPLPISHADLPPIGRAAQLLLPHLERGRRIDAPLLRAAMEAAFGASDASRRLGLEDRLRRL